MEIILTQWGLDSYLELKRTNTFNKSEFNKKIKPDVKLLKHYPEAPKFKNGKFWSPAAANDNIIVNGFKMKWHQIGNGRIQLGLPIAILDSAHLCGAYAKNDDKLEKRRLAKFKTHIQLIQENNYKHCGVVT